MVKSDNLPKTEKVDGEFGPEETARRRDEALLRALSTPPKHHSEMKLGKSKAKAGTKASPPKKRGRQSRKHLGC